MSMNWETHHKTKQAAVAHIFDCLANNPGIADETGSTGIMYGGEFITITPPKKKKKEFYAKA